MTSRRDFLKALGVGAAVAAVPAVLGADTLKGIKKLPPGAIFNKPEYPRSLTLSSASTCADTTIDVVAGQGARVCPNDVILNIRTAEQMLVAQSSRNHLTVIRGVGGFPYSMEAGDRLIIVASGLGAL